jgi:ubiquinone/menaquinone biosynthesis C-methylase UbiE
MESLWLLHPEEYNAIQNESRKLILHPLLATLIKPNEPTKLLDYGCGDGSFVQLLPENIITSLFDISNVSLSQAAKNLRKRKPSIYYEESSIPQDFFDYVIFSLVLMTIPTKRDIKKALTNIFNALKSNGILLAAVTHPCFRQYPFSTFHTSYSEAKTFHYFNDGENFKVYLRDNKSDNMISFDDYHWNLSTTLNLIIETQFQITKMIELPDSSELGKYHNPNFCPYLIIECKKL